MAHPDSISGTAKLPVSPWAGACRTPLLSLAGRGWSPPAVVEARLAPASIGPGPVRPYHGGEAGVGLVPGGGMRRSHCSRRRGCGSVDPWALWLVDPPGSEARPRPGSCTREPPLPDVGKAVRPHQEARPRVWAPDSQETCTGCAGRRLEGLPPPGPGAALGWGLARHLPPLPACVRGAARACTPLPKR